MNEENIEKLIKDIGGLFKVAMKNRSLTIIHIVLLLLLSPIVNTCGSVYAQSSPMMIYGKVVDANTGLPISNATVLVWDLNTLATPKLGAGIYFTDENGEYRVSGGYLKEGHTYFVLAYKGDFNEKTAKIEYVPAMRRNVHIEYGEEKNVSFSLIPGAVIEVTDAPYIVQSPSPEVLRNTIKVIPKEKITVPFIDEYGDSSNTWWLRLPQNIVIIPADVPVILEAKVWFLTGEFEYLVNSETFFIYNSSLPFQLPQGGIYSCSLSQYGLNGGLKFLKSKLFVDVSNQIDKAQDAGFVVFDERQLLTNTYKEMVQAKNLLANAKNPKDYLEIWVKLREVFGTLNFISSTLKTKRLIAMTSAVYLSAIMAAFSTTLAFFLFEKEKRKIISSIIVFIVYLTLLYFFHPGAHIIIEENINLFLSSSLLSFVGVSLLVFGIPHIWKERTIEGKVSWISAITVIFSMSKRQIKR